jgi:lipooligosaccharide transport system ATP-binding protein
MIIEAENLTKRYGKFTAVDRVSFSIAKGECFGFLGPNGAGKTTIMRMIQGVSPITEGSLYVFGMDVAKSARKIKERMGVIPQENNLDPDLTALKNLLVYARYFDIERKEAEERAVKLLSFLELSDKKERKIWQLSTGYKRRLVVARALINEPDLLILDEPTTGLDPAARHLIWKRLGEFKERGITMVLTTHYMDEAAHLCDRLVIMDRGRFLCEGVPEELVAERLGDECIEIRVDEAEREALRRMLQQSELCYQETGDTFYIFSKDGDRISEFMETKHKKLIHRKPTLEDLFLQLSGRKLSE